MTHNDTRRTGIGKRENHRRIQTSRSQRDSPFENLLTAVNVIPQAMELNPKFLKIVYVDYLNSKIRNPRLLPCRPLPKQFRPERAWTCNGDKSEPAKLSYFARRPAWIPSAKEDDDLRWRSRPFLRLRPRSRRSRNVASIAVQSAASRFGSLQSRNFDAVQSTTWRPSCRYSV